MQRVSAVRLFALSASLLLAACADAPTRPSERVLGGVRNASLISAAPLSFRQISNGGGYHEAHTCGVTTSNVAYCWGSNGTGQLGVGNRTGLEQCNAAGVIVPCSSRPVPVAGALAFRAVAAGRFHTCGVTTDKVAYCWGGNFLGQLGIGTLTGPELCSPSGTPCSTRPVAVVGPRR
jgi:hypothetical protein